MPRSLLIKIIWSQVIPQSLCDKHLPMLILFLFEYTVLAILRLKTLLLRFIFIFTQEVMTRVRSAVVAMKSRSCGCVMNLNAFFPLHLRNQSAGWIMRHNFPQKIYCFVYRSSSLRGENSSLIIEIFQQKSLNKACSMQVQWYATFIMYVRLLFSHLLTLLYIVLIYLRRQSIRT